MGGFTSKTEQDLKFYLQRSYDITHYPNIIQKQNKKEAIVHQITTDSTEQAQRIRSDVNLYKHLGCKSISSILEYIPLQSNKICSDQQYHYIVEEDMQKYNLKEEFFARKYYKEKFTNNQILSVIKAFLCGLNIYHSQFHRKFHGPIRLDWMTVDQSHSNHLRLTDPLLMTDFNFNQNVSLSEKQQSRSKSRINNFFHDDHNSVREAPERIEIKKTHFNENKIQLNELLADMYGVGIISLELYRMELLEKRQQIGLWIQKISDTQLKRIIKLLTSVHGESRGQVFEIMKVSGQQSYCLQKCFRKGNMNREQIVGSKINELNRGFYEQNGEKGSKLKQTSKQSSYSFGVSLNPHQTRPVNNYIGTNHLNHSNPVNHSNNMNNIHNTSIHNPYNNVSNNNSNFNEAIPITTVKSIQPLSNVTHSSNIFQLPFKSFEPTKTQSLSNMSTDRTIYHNKFINTTNTHKPTVNFNSSTNLPPFTTSTSYSSNLTLHPQTSHYISATQSSLLLNKDKEHEKPRANSFLLNDDKKYTQTNYNAKPILRDYSEKPVLKDNDSNTILKEKTKLIFKDDNSKPIQKHNDSSAYNKHQDISPLFHKEQQLEEGNFKQIFDKYSHLNYQSYTPSPNKVIENKKMQQEMDKLLKQSSAKPIQNIKQENSQINRSPIGKGSKTNSPINALDLNLVATFSTGQKNVNEQSQTSINQQIPVYRPNKEVEEILKRLGIGSLLYGNGENSKEQENEGSGLQESGLTKNEKQFSEQQESEAFVHRGTYNIHKQVQFSTNKINESNNYEDIHDRQTTPIRRANKNKYNSTIVEVGDEDSQYSESGVRNTQHNIDLSNHEYVVEEYQTGSRYEGYKLNAERDGHGKFFYQDGGYYEGQWRNNKMDGWGKLYYEGGKLAYEGNWCQDEFHGFGKVYNDNPLQLQCGFDFTNFDLLQDYWEYYEGMLVKDTKEGRGKIMLTNAEMFEGDFHNDRIQGFGKFFMKEGTMIEGIWRDSKLIKIISS